MKQLILAILTLCLFAAPAFGDTRAVHPGLVQTGNPTVTLLEYNSAEVTTTAQCLNLNGLGISTTATQFGIRATAACDDLKQNQYVFPRAAKITNLRVTPTFIGDVGYICVFTIEIDAVAAGATLTTTVDLAAGTAEAQAQNFTVAAGAKVGIMVANGTTCGSGTADPSFNVQIEGEYL